MSLELKKLRNIGEKGIYGELEITKMSQLFKIMASKLLGVLSADGFYIKIIFSLTCIAIPQIRDGGVGESLS